MSGIFSFKYETKEISVSDKSEPITLDENLLAGFNSNLRHYAGDKILADSITTDGFSDPSIFSMEYTLDEGNTDWIKDTFAAAAKERSKTKMSGEHEDSVRLKPNEGIKQKSDAHTAATKAARSVKGNGYGAAATDEDGNEIPTQSKSTKKEFKFPELKGVFGSTAPTLRGTKTKVKGKDMIDVEGDSTSYDDHNQHVNADAQHAAGTNQEAPNAVTPDAEAVKIHNMLHGATRSIFSIQHIQAALAKGMSGNNIIAMSRSATGRKQLRSIKEEIELDEGYAGYNSDARAKFVCPTCKTKGSVKKDSAGAHKCTECGTKPGYYALKSAGVFKVSSNNVKEEIELDEASTYVVKHDGVNADHPDEAAKKIFLGKKNITNHVTKYEDSAIKTKKLLASKGYNNVRVEKNGKVMESISDDWDVEFIKEEIELDEGYAGYNSDARAKFVCPTCKTKGSVKKDSAGSHKCTECGTKPGYYALKSAGVFKVSSNNIKECISDNWDVEIIKENGIHRYIIRDEDDIIAEGVNLTYDGALKSALRKSNELAEYIMEQVSTITAARINEEEKPARILQIAKNITNK